MRFLLTNMSTPLLTKVRLFCQKHGLFVTGDKVVVGLSGGLDSVCLLHILRILQSEWGLTLIIAHLNHELRGAASQADEQFVRELAQAWQLPLYVESQPVAKLAIQRKQSLEEAARQARYEFLGRVAAEVQATKIAVAHQADDQAETVLMHLLRGTGTRGLRGMLPLTVIGQAALIRPLLEVTRQEIEQYQQAMGLAFSQDESNNDLTFWRNRLRHEVLPYLEQYNPQLRSALRQLAHIAVADMALVDDTLNQVWPKLAQLELTGRVEFDLGCWFTLPLSLQRAALRRAIYQVAPGVENVGFEPIEQAIQLISGQQTGAQATLPQGIILRVSYQCLVITQPDFKAVSPTPALMNLTEITVVVPGVTSLPETDWQLHAQILPMTAEIMVQVKQADSWSAYLDADLVTLPLTLRTRRAGDKFAPWGLQGQQQKIKNFMINAKIPSPQRNQIPLLVADEQIVWVCGYRMGHPVAVQPNTSRLLYLSFVLLPF